MRVCVIMSVLDTFKGGNHLPLLAALPDIQFTVVTNRVKTGAGDALPLNVSVEIIPGRLGSYYYGIADWRFAALTLKEFSPHHPFWKQFDVIHLNQVLGARFAKLQASGVPVVYAVHHPVTADRAVAIEESCGWESFFWRMRYALPVMAQKKLCSNISCVMTVSSTVRQRLVADYGCDPKNIHIVPNGVDEEEFTLSDKKPSFDAIAVGSFIHPRKGFPYLADVYRKLSAEGKRIADVGRRSQAQENILRSIPGVTVFGSVKHQQLVDLMQTSSVLVSTALYEGFGLSLIEALASGHPAFAFDGGAVSEVLRPIDLDLVVPLRDTKELARRVSAFLASDPAERTRIGIAYRERVVGNYSLTTSADALRRLYGSLSARRLKTI